MSTRRIRPAPAYDPVRRTSDISRLNSTYDGQIAELAVERTLRDHDASSRDSITLQDELKEIEESAEYQLTTLLRGFYNVEIEHIVQRYSELVKQPQGEACVEALRKAERRVRVSMHLEV
ncbi:uncharacterized protein JCM6883_007581 [Sporobolomyces salmoneus]|uniref:uncharacterized protein n=1 Tax=Sporobolomyces salmoneus TaxID=183962 RepID=UPI00316F667F